MFLTVLSGYPDKQLQLAGSTETEGTESGHRSCGGLSGAQDQPGVVEHMNDIGQECQDSFPSFKFHMS